MHSPIHNDVILERVELEPGLEAWQCPKSKGVWIPLQSYTTWHEGHRDKVRELAPDYRPVVETSGNSRALICPESGCVLIRHRVGNGLSFHIDRSPKTGGVWLEAGEWDALKSKNLHEEMHMIFGAPYQRRLRNDESRVQLKKLFAQRLGAGDFVRVNEFKHWLNQHKHKREIVAYLLDEDGND